MYRWAHIIPYSLVYTYFCQAFTILRAMIFVHLFQEFSSGSLSFTYVLVCVSVLSPHLDQFPPFAYRIVAKHLACTLMRGRIGHVKQLSDRRVQIYSDYTLLAFAISLFPLLLCGGFPIFKDIFLLNFLVIGNL